jgi:uncharacterized protein (TIGR03435 family)
MLRTLLAERFRLKVRRETKTGAVYPLERSGRKFLPGPTKYTEDKPVLGTPGFSGAVERTGGHRFLSNTSLPQLARFASDYGLHKPVIDQTGLEGSLITASRMRASPGRTATSKARSPFLSTWV